jgi:hypothetical protein
MTQTVTTKKELIDYLGCVKLGNSQELIEKSDEIIQKVGEVMKEILEQEGEYIFRKYYEPKLIEEAHSQEDSRGFVHALARLYNFLKE